MGNVCGDANDVKNVPKPLPPANSAAAQAQRDA